MILSAPFGGLIPGATGEVLSVLLRTGAALTGRQVHALVDGYSLWSVQEALKSLAQVGVVHTVAAGRAHLHSINEDHVMTAPLRVLADPIAALTRVITDIVQQPVDAVVLFGSLARGDARPGSDIDLAVITPSPWNGRIDLQDAIAIRFGNECDVLAFTTAEFNALRLRREPVVDQILRDGVTLLGQMPHRRATAS